MVRGRRREGEGESKGPRGLEQSLRSVKSQDATVFCSRLRLRKSGLVDCSAVTAGSLLIKDTEASGFEVKGQ